MLHKKDQQVGAGEVREEKPTSTDCILDQSLRGCGLEVDLSFKPEVDLLDPEQYRGHAGRPGGTALRPSDTTVTLKLDDDTQVHIECGSQEVAQQIKNLISSSKLTLLPVKGSDAWEVQTSFGEKGTLEFKGTLKLNQDRDMCSDLLRVAGIEPKEEVSKLTDQRIKLTPDFLKAYPEMREQMERSPMHAELLDLMHREGIRVNVEFDQEGNSAVTLTTGKRQHLFPIEAGEAGPDANYDKGKRYYATWLRDVVTIVAMSSDSQELYDIASVMNEAASIGKRLTSTSDQDGSHLSLVAEGHHTKALSFGDQGADTVSRRLKGVIRDHVSGQIDYLISKLSSLQSSDFRLITPEHLSSVFLEDHYPLLNALLGDVIREDRADRRVTFQSTSGGVSDKENPFIVSLTISDKAQGSLVITGKVDFSSPSYFSSSLGKALIPAAQLPIKEQELLLRAISAGVTWQPVLEGLATFPTGVQAVHGGLPIGAVVRYPENGDFFTARDLIAPLKEAEF